MRVSRSDLTGRFDSSRRTPQGGLKLPAFVTRTGVLTYRQPDGSTIRELRHPDEVFNADSLASLAGAPLTVGHPGKVQPGNWKAHSVGHVGDTVEQKDRFVATTLRVQDETTVKAVEAGQLLELSCGYDCDMDNTPGEFEGEKYDAIQRNISYNHVALLPVNGGRAGNDVRIRFDGLTEPGDIIPETILEEGSKLSGMTPEQIAAMNAELAKAKQDHADAKTALDKVTGERDQLSAQVATLSDPKRMDALVDARVKLHEDARTILPEAVFSGKSDREIMTEALTKIDSAFKCDAETSTDYLRGRFDTAVAGSKVGAASLANVRTAVTDSQTSDTPDLIADAKAKADKRSADAWKVTK